LKALAADGCFEVIAGKKAGAALGTPEAVHLALRLPAIEESHDSLLT